LKELFDLLHDQAARQEDFTTPPPSDDYLWSVRVNAAIVHVHALTRKLSREPDDAWRSATELRGAILALGYKIHGTCQIGVVSEIGKEDPHGPGWEFPICGWRGQVTLNMRSTSS
jgi:hypothetical protein